MTQAEIYEKETGFPAKKYFVTGTNAGTSTGRANIPSDEYIAWLTSKADRCDALEKERDFFKEKALEFAIKINEFNCYDCRTTTDDADKFIEEYGTKE